MSRSRLAVIAILAVAPFLFLMGVGSYHLYQTGWVFVAWWPMTASLITAYGLAFYWTRRASLRLLPETATAKPPEYWTDRDRLAWNIVAQKAATIVSITPTELENPNRFTDDAMALSLNIAKNYHPSATDPFGHLTLIEILTCAELVAHDLGKKVNEFIPFSHVVTVKQFRQARQAVDWGQKAWNISWLARAMINPVKTATQYAVSRAGGSVLTRVQNNVLLWFYTAYLHELGRYLIELNSGRLKVGAKRYMELIAAHKEPPTVGASPGGPVDTTESSVASLNIMLIGQVKAGKSSLTNAILGENRAPTDVIPLTVGAVRYECQQPNLPKFTLVDTAGYGAGGPSETEFEFAMQQAGRADFVLFVLHARNAARKTDIDFFERLCREVSAKQDLRLPPIVGVLTHIDLLAPAMEWNPPYDWKAGTRPKEVNMREAIESVREAFSGQLTEIIPVCTANGKVYNISEELILTIARHLDHARGSALLRIFHQEGNANTGKKAVDQMLNAGREALKILWESAKKG